MSASRGERAVVLLSGGLDSATALAVAMDQGFRCVTLAIDYGQRHRVELAAARAVSARAGAAEHRQIAIDLRAIGGSALTADIDVPKRPGATEVEPGIPITYVPARNLIFLSLAGALAETLAARAIFVGVNAVDYSGYPDCRRAFIDAFGAALNLGTRAGVEHAGDAHDAGAFVIHTPLDALSKAEIIRLGHRLGVAYELTTSCYDPSLDAEGRPLACGACDSCVLRARGFAEAGVADPTRYLAGSRGNGR